MDAAAKSEVRDIIITHFLNPHQFWYQIETISINEKLCQLEREIQEYFLRHQRHGNFNIPYSPKINEIVAVFIVTQNRWIRAVVDEIYKFANTDQYILWQIDYGKPLMSEAKYIRRIEDKLAKFEVESVFFGGLNNILPADKVFNYATGSSKCELINKWSEKAIKTCENSLNIAYTRTFHIEEYYNGQYFGQLLITTDSTKQLNMKNILVEINEGISNTDKFYEILDEYELNKSSRWLEPNGRCNLFKFGNNTRIIQQQNINYIPSTISRENHFENEIDTENQLPINEKVKKWQEKSEQTFGATNNTINYDNIDSISVVDATEILNQTKSPQGGKFEKEKSNKFNNITDDTNSLEKPCFDRRNNLLRNKDVSQIKPPRDNDLNIVPGFDLAEDTKILSITKSIPQSSLSVYDDDKKSVVSIETDSSANRMKRLQRIQNKFNKPKQSIISIPAGYDLSQLNAKKNDHITFSPNQIKNQSNQQSSKPKEEYKTPTNGNCSGLEILTNKSNFSNRNETQILPDLRMDYTRPRTTQQRIKVDNTLRNVNEVCIPRCSIGKDSVLVHGSIPIPINTIAEAKFTSEIHAELERSGINNIQRIQQYAWPHLQHLNSLVLINSAGTGKTFAYLPMICSLINIQKDDGQILDDVGPIGIIIVPFRSNAEDLLARCRHFTKKNVICTGERNKSRAIGELQSNADLLITTPEGINLLKKNNIKCINQKRLKHLIIENLNLWDDQSREILKDVFKKFQSTNVQIVITSQIWDPTLEILLNSKKLNNPLLCIGAPIEAAVYAKVNFKLKIVKKKSKINEVQNFVKKHLDEKIIIFCNDDAEVEEVTNTLKNNGEFVQSCTKLLHADDIRELSSSWNNLYNENIILVTTDDFLTELHIQNAENLIHYSLNSSSWTRTCYRFCVFLKYYADRVKDGTSNQSHASTLILLDEENNEQLPKLINFLERSKQEINPEIKNLAEKIEIEREKSKSRPLCENWLEFNKIHDKTKCNERHSITCIDAPANDLPCQGMVEVQIISCESPIHYCVRLLKHRLHYDSVWQIARQSNEYIKFLYEFSTYYSNIDNHQLYEPILNDLCVVKDNDRYERGRIIEILKTKPGYVETKIKLIDLGKLHKFQTNQLLFLHDKFKEFPPQAVDLYLTDVVPYDNEELWDKKLTDTIRNWIEKYKNNTGTYIAYINFSLSNIIYADEIIIREYLPSLKIYNNKLYIKKNAIQKEIVKKIDDNDSNEIRSLSKQLFYKPVLQKESADDNIPKDVKEYQEFDDNKISKLNDSSSASTFSNDEISIQMMNHQAVQRARPNRTKKNIIENFDGSNQSIQENNKKLIFDQTWQKLNGNEFSKIQINQFHSLKDVYVCLQDNKKLLQNKINNFICNGTEFVQKPIIGSNYLAKIDEIYSRCKITSLNCDSNGLVANVFFCDDGLFRNCKITELRTTNSEIINFLPYQAIHCSLIGISSKNVDQHLTEEEYKKIYTIIKSEQLYARPMMDGIQNKHEILKYWIYEIILNINSTGEDIQINKELIKLGYAIGDPNTAHYLDTGRDKQYNHSKFDLDNYDNSDEEEWEDDPNATKFDYKSVLSLNQNDIIGNNNDINSNINFTEEELMEFDINFTEEELKQLQSLQETNDVNSVPENVQTETDHNFKTNAELSTVENTNEKLQLKEMDKNPSLISIYKMPNVIWQQSDELICLKILAPDIKDYYLNVTNSSLIFAALIDDEMKVLSVNFFGCIDETVVSHEIRGLTVIIRLLKKIQGKRFSWPRLTNETDKHNWLKYNYEAIVMEHEKFDNSVKQETYCRYASDSDSEFDENLEYETHTKIENPEDVYDVLD